MDDFQRLDIREKAATRLRSGVLSGAGGWKDLMTIAVTLGSVVEFIKSWAELTGSAS